MEKERLNDLISRKEAIEAVEFFAVDPGDGYNDIANERNRVLEYASDKIMHIPPTQRWHTEPPEENGFYIVCTDSGEVGECVYMDNGKWDTDRNYRFPMWCQVVAWMPMPPAYKKDGE